jgi:hypothetical protein
MKASRVQSQLLEEIQELTTAQCALLLDLVRSLKEGRIEPTPPRQLGPLRLHLSSMSPHGTFSREGIYGDDGR